jgi:hypothetical protein
LDQYQCAAHQSPIVTPKAHGRENYLPLSDRRSTKPLAKALAFRDAGKMPEAREWAAELVRLLKSHDLLK